MEELSKDKVQHDLYVEVGEVFVHVPELTCVSDDIMPSDEFLGAVTCLKSVGIDYIIRQRIVKDGDCI